jgi:hypothetical protein
MLTPDKRTRLIQLLGMIGSHHDGEALNAARLAQRLIGAEAMTWEEVFNGVGGGNGSGRPPSGDLISKAYHKGHADGFRDGLAKGHATATVKRTPAASGWQALAQMLLDNYQLTEWETGFCESFLTRGFDTPTEKQHGVFERICRKFDQELPE